MFSSGERGPVHYGGNGRLEAVRGGGGHRSVRYEAAFPNAISGGFARWSYPVRVPKARYNTGCPGRHIENFPPLLRVCSTATMIAVLHYNGVIYDGHVWAAAIVPHRT